MTARASNALRIIALGACAAVSAASFGPGDGGPPEPDSCESPESASFDVLEVGAGNDSQFEELTEGSVVHPVTGGQGLDMITVRYRVEGASVPECISHETILFRDGDSGEEIGHETLPLRLHTEGAGAATNTLFVVLFGGSPQPGQPVLLRVRAGLTTVDRNLWIEEVGADAGP